MIFIRRLMMSVLLALASTQIWAQASHTLEHAQRCAGIFALMTQTQTQNEVTLVRLQRMTTLFDEIYTGETSSTPNPNTAIHLSMSAEIQKEMPSRQAELKEEGVLCGAWGQSMLAQGEHLKFVTVFPKVIALSVRQEFQPLSEQTFSSAR